MFRFRGVIQIYSHSQLGGCSDLGGSFMFAGSVMEVKCLSASGIKTILSEAKQSSRSNKLICDVYFKCTVIS